jgi:hypothetical protein
MVLSTSRQADLEKPYPVAQASRLCRRRLKPAATKIIFVSFPSELGKQWRKWL